MTLDDVTWAVVPYEIPRMVKTAAPVVVAYLHARGAGGPDFVWFNPDTGCLRESAEAPPGYGAEAWMPVKTAAGVFRPLFDALQLTPNPVNALAGGPTPVAASLAGGLLGAGLGYGAGYAGEKLLGEDVLEPGRLRWVGALGGGVAGTLPGAYLGAVGARLKAKDGHSAAGSAKALVEPNVLLGKQSLARDMLEDLAEELPHVDARFLKSAMDAGAMYMPMIPVDAFNRTVWADPNTPPEIRAATTGLVQGASQLRGGVNLISPADVGRIAVGMGSGLVSGMLVGKALGAMAGLTPDAQRTLKQTGMWAGALSNIVPLAFGGGR